LPKDTSELAELFSVVPDLRGGVLQGSRRGGGPLAIFSIPIKNNEFLGIKVLEFLL